MKWCCCHFEWKKLVVRGVQAAICVLAATALFGCTGSPTLPPLPGASGTGESVTADELCIGILTPMTGELATFGELTRNGVRLAMDQWNETGGVNGQPVVWALADTECDAVAARQAAERLVADGVHFLVGGLCSESAIAIANVAYEQDALFVAVAATHPLVTVAGEGGARPTVFRAAYEYSYQGEAAARFLLEQQRLSQAVVIYDPSDAYQAALAEAFARRLTDGGGRAVQVTASSPDGVDWAAVRSQLAEGEPTALYAPAAAAFTQGLAGQERFAVVMGSETWRRAEGELAGLEGAFFTDHFDVDVDTKSALAWSQNYESAFAQRPDTLAVLGYEAMDVLLHGVDEADSVAPAIVAGHIEVMDYDGVIGIWRFDKWHNPIKSVVVVQVADGGARFLSLISPDR